MAKLTIEIDMEDSQETWDALYRRIEQFAEEPEEAQPEPSSPVASPLTYDLLLDPERAPDPIGDFFAMAMQNND